MTASGASAGPKISIRSAGGARLGDVARDELRRLLVAGRHDERDEPAERRQEACRRTAISRSMKASRSPAMIACHDRVLGHVRLHEAAPLGERAAGAARHLVQKLERALARARVGALARPKSPSTMPTVASCGK